MTATYEFTQAPPSRFVVTNLDGVVRTFTDGIGMSKAVTLNLNAPSQGTFNGPSDNPGINLTPGGGSLIPFLSMGDKLLYWFRGESFYAGDGGDWVCRFAGIVQQINDEIEATTDAATSEVTVYDSWGFLNTIPVLNAAGNNPGADGITYNGATAYEIATDLLYNAKTGIVNMLAAVPISAADVPLASLDLFLNWGQNPYMGVTYNTDGAACGGTAGTGPTADMNPCFTGVAEPGSLIPQINFQQGISVGAALTQMVQAGYCDIIMTPVWDPINQPGILNQLNFYCFAGAQKPGAWFGWDKPGRSLVGMNRMQDGTQLGNVGIGYAGSSGPSVPVFGPATAVVAPSVEEYGPYWFMTTYPTELATNTLVIQLIAGQALLLQNGLQSLTLDIAPEMAPRPFIDYNLADLVPVMASSNFRLPIMPSLSTNASVIATSVPTGLDNSGSGSITIGPTNDKFDYNGVTYGIPNGTYTDTDTSGDVISAIENLATAVQAATSALPSDFSSVVTVSVIGQVPSDCGLALEFTDITGSSAAGNTVNTASSDNALADLGFGDGQAMRQVWTNYHRIYSIPFVINDDGVEQITAMDLTPPALNTTSSV